MITESGSYRISEDDYHADNICETPSLSRGIIKSLIMDCPAKAFLKHPRLNPKFKTEEKGIFDLGKLAHAILLEGNDKVKVIDASDWRTKVAQEARDKARKEGFIPMLPHQYDEVLAMVAKALESLSDIGINVREGDSELTYIWKERKTWMRVRPDWINKKRTICIDYKTTGTIAQPEEYSRIVASTGLDIQRAFYTRGVRAVDGVVPQFLFMVQETCEPYLCSFIELDTMFREMGEQKVHKGIALWERCLSLGEWPGYPSRIHEVSPKPWALASWEMQMNA